MAHENLTYDDLLRIVELIKSTEHFSEFRLKVGDIELELRHRSSGACSAGFVTGRGRRDRIGGRYRGGARAARRVCAMAGRFGGYPLTDGGNVLSRTATRRTAIR